MNKLKKSISIFLNRRLNVMGIIVASVIMGIVYTVYFVTPKYESYTTVAIIKPIEGEEAKTITLVDIDLAKSLISTYKEIAESNSVLRATIKKLNINESEEALRKKISVKEIKNAGMMRITVKDENPVMAMKIASELTKVFTEKVADMYANNIYVLDEAEESITPCNINHTRDIAISFAIGFVASIIYVGIVSIYDEIKRDMQDVEKKSEIKTMALIPIMYRKRKCSIMVLIKGKIRNNKLIERLKKKFDIKRKSEPAEK